MGDKYSDCLLPFDSDDPDFIRGFEAGRVWAMLQETDEREFTVHWANAEMMLRIAEALGIEVQSEELDDAWCHVTFTGDPQKEE